MIEGKRRVEGGGLKDPAKVRGAATPGQVLHYIDTVLFFSQISSTSFRERVAAEGARQNGMQGRDSAVSFIIFCCLFKDARSLCHRASLFHRFISAVGRR